MSIGGQLPDFGATMTDRVSGSDRVAYALESPKYHRLRFDEVNPFSGWLLYFGPRIIQRLRLLQDGSTIGEFPVNLPRPDIAQYVPYLSAAARCGFGFEHHVSSVAKTVSLLMEYDDGAVEPFADYDVAYGRRCRENLQRMARAVDGVPPPSVELLLSTHASRDVREYTESTVPAVTSLVTYLRDAGCDIRTIRSILDFGCGIGRLLVGWWALDPTRHLFGCDLDAALIDWNIAHLPKEIAFLKNDLHSRLPYDDGTFDLICLISVFTHLSISSQRLWARELHRILRPGGALPITLHGESYVCYVYRDDRDHVSRFLREGYLELTSPREGSYEFGAFHTLGVVRELFRGFRLRAFFPNGRIDGRRQLFPLAMLQDVYVFRREPETSGTATDR